MKKIKNTLLIIGLVASPFIAIMAQPGPPPGGGPGNDPPCWPPPCIPIDGGVSLLVAAGLAFGGKKVYNISKQKG